MVLRSSSQLSRASVTCLLGVEQGVEEFFAVATGVFDVLAGRGAGWRRPKEMVDVPVVVHARAQTVQFLDKVVAVAVVVQVRMVPDVQKTFGGAADAVLRCWGRLCDHAALMAVCMAMGRLMGFATIWTAPSTRRVTMP